jgi:histidinol-phosphatase (PHP family)
MEDYVEHAIDIGLEEIGFAEHMPVMPESHLCMSYDDLPFYIERVRTLHDRYSDSISIKLGAEIDMNFERIDEIERIIETYEFDYVIGSVHYLDDWPFDQKQYKDKFEKGDVNEIYKRFFDAIIQAVQSGLYDIAGHIDNLKRMGYRPTRDITDCYERVAAVLQKMDVAIEINTSGYDYPAGESYPSISFLQVLNRYGVPVTFGSDSHKPEHVGRHFEKAYGILEKAGYDGVAYFEKRKRIIKPVMSAV